MKVRIKKLPQQHELNAKHWKHGLGGNLFLDGGDEDKLIDWIIREEGFLPTPKNIGDGKITLGSGLTNPKWHELYKKRGNKWSEADNRKAVAEEIALRRLWAEQNIPNWQILPVDSQNAMLSYKYNYDFNENNSPKMYAALKAKDWEEAAKQMDATSSDPKFKKGLEERRLREQKLFLSGFTNSPMGPILPKKYADYQETAEPVSIQPILPFLIEQPLPAPIMVPNENQYVSVHTQTQEDIDRQEQQRAIERLNNIERFNRLMNLISVQNNQTPTFIPQNAPYTVNTNAFGGNLFSGEEDRSQQMDNEFPFGDRWLKEVPVYGDVKRARRANNWLLNRGLVPRWSSLGNGKGTFSFLPQDQPIQQGLEIVSPEFDVLAMGNIFKPLLKATTKTIPNNIKYLKGIDRYGNSYELPVRTLREGINDVNGNIISDAELVDNWKRSQDFYKMRLRNAGLKQEAPVYIKNRDDAAKIIQKYDPSLSKAEALEQIDDGGGGYASTSTGDDGYAIITKELNTMGKQRRGTTNSAYVHEDAHLLRGPEDDGMEDITWSNLRLRKDEAAARGTQIKSMLGIKDNAPITSEQLKYMKDNFVRLTGMDNYMQLFLNSIEDFDNAAKWLSKYSYSLGGAMNLLDVIPHRKGKNIKGL